MSAVVLVVELRAEPGQRARYLARAREHRKNVLDNEPGCQRFELLVPDDSDDTIFLCEIYDDDQAFEDHLNTAYMKAYMDDTAPMLAYRKRNLCRLAND